MICNVKPSDIKGLKLLCVIIDRKWIKKLEKVYRRHDVRPNLSCFAMGTANNEMLDYFGLNQDEEKDVVISLLPAGEISDVYNTLQEEMSFKKPGRGIAFTIPAEGMVFSWPGCDQHISREEQSSMREGHDYSLTITVVERGGAEDVMKYAREAGATGGTIIHSRSLADVEEKKFFGISIADEADILAVLVKNDIKDKVIEALRNALNREPDTEGMVVVLPVDSVFGLAKSMEMFE